MVSTAADMLDDAVRHAMKAMSDDCGLAYLEVGVYRIDGSGDKKKRGVGSHGRKVSSAGNAWIEFIPNKSQKQHLRSISKSMNSPYFIKSRSTSLIITETGLSQKWNLDKFIRAIRRTIQCGYSRLIVESDL